MIEELQSAPRLLIDASLRPVLGSTFQPTGFANLGAAEFQRPGEPRALLVESVQSLANHFESLGFDAPAGVPIPLLEELPWIGVHSVEGERLTSSRQEPHRLAAVYVREAAIDGTGGTAWLSERLGLRPRQPLRWPAIYAAVFELDPLCLLHGVFFPELHGSPKVRRAISAVIEAHDVAPAVSGGVKRDDVQVQADKQGGQGAKEGYGFVPFGRTEYVAREIRFSASIDLEQIRGYGLDAVRTRLLTLLAVWEVVALLGGPLRLRTACDLEVEEISVRRPGGYVLPSRGDVEAAVTECGAPFESRGERVATWPAPKAK